MNKSSERLCLLLLPEAAAEELRTIGIQNHQLRDTFEQHLAGRRALATGHTDRVGVQFFGVLDDRFGRITPSFAE